MKQKVNEYEWLRVILTILVVYGHSYYNVLFYGVGGKLLISIYKWEIYLS